ncbi:hypothetical protein BDW72DRAFT_207750 [Aspergillus terricola var. indicus]
MTEAERTVAEAPVRIFQMSNISAESHGRASAVYADHSTSNTFQGGIHHHHQQHERPEPRPEPLSTVPFALDPDFVSRDALHRIHDIASSPGSRMVLVGLGGVGKTQLAIEYSHQVRRESPDTWVIWIHASNAARCHESLQEFARKARIPGYQDPNAHIFQLVGDWLGDERTGKWIMVLDNVDDGWLLRKPLATGQSNASKRPPLEYIPRNSKGSVIITSRDKRLGLRMAHPRNIIEVQPMTKAEALALLQKKLDVSQEREDMRLLVEALECMPLAIVQAAAYITHRSPRCSVSQYLEKIEKSDREVIRLLSHEPDHINRDWEAKNSIPLTWQISFDHIQETRPSAVGLLSLMSFFDRQGIPESVLRVGQGQDSIGEVEDNSSEEHGDNASISDADQYFEDDITTLRDYSLISIGEKSTVLTMHRLVQLTVRAWLKEHGQLELWKETFISNLCREFPTGEYENWAKCRQLFPHVILAIPQRPENRDSQRDWATLLYRGAWYAYSMGNFLDASKMSSESRKQRVAIFGADGEESLDSTAMLALAYSLEGRWEEAEQLEVQGRWEEAEQLEVQVMEASKAKLGDAHPDTLTSMASLAFTWKSSGKDAEAINLLRDCLARQKQTIGPNHPNTISNSEALIKWETEDGQ